jgi:catechol 2,3-dioxygenase-like lactoylglutathione lyase family enzyme
MEPVFRKIDCLSLPVPNLDEALAFYQGAIGHELVWRDETAAGLRLPDDDAELVLHVAARPAEVDLLVESVPVAVQALTAAGAELVAGPFEIRIGLCAVLRDPWKNPLVILDSSKGLLKVDAARSVRSGCIAGPGDLVE